MLIAKKLLLYLPVILFANLATAQQYDVVIDEIMADPSPSIALPNNEWRELKNTSAVAINLKGWKIGDLAGVTGAMPNFILMPDSFVIVCATSANAAMALFGATITITDFPSFNNDGDQLSLFSSDGKIIHSVNYSSAWYQNDLKKDGGWTLEMIDTKNPCSGMSNWKASTDVRGGSPGSKNATDAINRDEIAPKLLRAYAADNKNIVLVFDESLDSLQAANINNYNISDGIGTPIAAVATPPAFDKVNIQLDNPLHNSKVYTITATGITDCVGNATSNKSVVRVGLSDQVDSLDIVINEILFNPPPSGSDYIEIITEAIK